MNRGRGLFVASCELGAMRRASKSYYELETRNRFIGGYKID